MLGKMNSKQLNQLTTLNFKPSPVYGCVLCIEIHFKPLVFCEVKYGKLFENSMQRAKEMYKSTLVVPNIFFSKYRLILKLIIWKQASVKDLDKVAPVKARIGKPLQG